MKKYIITAVAITSITTIAFGLFMYKIEEIIKEDVKCN